MTESQALDPAPAVVVGVDGTPASVGAVRYGLEEARAAGCRLRLVHVLPEFEAFGSPYPLPDERLRTTGRAILQDALDAAGGRPGDPEVELVLRRGPRVPTLTALARAARVLVVGADHHAITTRLLTGNTTSGVAASSLAPVVSVPEGWRPDAHGSAPVLVGVKGSPHAHELLGTAFAAARRTGRGLVALHAWRLPSGYDDIIVDRVAAGEWEARAAADMESLVAEWRPGFPDVDVELRVVHDQAAHALVEASRSARELVLVRRAHGIPAAVHLGPTARAVLRSAHCPVRVVPPGLDVDQDDRVAAAAPA